MGRDEYIQKRRRKYLAEVMDFFDDMIVPMLGPDTDNRVVDDFRGLQRAKFNALAVDAIDVIGLDDVQINGYATDTRDRLLAGRTATARS